MTEDLQIGFCPVTPEGETVFCPLYAHCTALLGLNDDTTHDEFLQVHDGVVEAIKTQRVGYFEAKEQVKNCLLADSDTAVRNLPRKFTSLLVYERMSA